MSESMAGNAFINFQITSSCAYTFLNSALVNMMSLDNAGSGGNG